MSRADFDRFVERKQQEKAEADSFDAQRELANWRRYLDGLYVEVQGFLKAYIDAGYARVTFHSIEINEDFSGPYEAPQMDLTIGGSTIRFKPIGTLLIGSKGRVDVHGPRGTARLGLIRRAVTHSGQMIRVSVSFDGDRPPAPDPVPDETDWVWKIITAAPTMKFIELTDDSFFDMMIGVADA